MSDLIALAFEDEYRATEVLQTLAELQTEHLIDLDDAVVVVKDEHGKLTLHQSHDLTAAGAAGGAWWGLLLGMVLSIPLAGPGALALPLLGTAAGALGGAVGGHYADIGIDDVFIRDISSRLQPSTSAIFMLVRKVTLDKVLPELGQFGGTLLHTSLAPEDDARLQDALRTIEAHIQRMRAEEQG
ncbi:MAG: DUF1269 domain-containing protein [Chloroflexaceae bacterium]|nr:DUF1269 domain-containing protein [Chloroflexaceae bacterium]